MNDEDQKSVRTNLCNKCIYSKNQDFWDQLRIIFYFHFFFLWKKITVCIFFDSQSGNRKHYIFLRPKDPGFHRWTAKTLIRQHRYTVWSVSSMSPRVRQEIFHVVIQHCSLNIMPLIIRLHSVQYILLRWWWWWWWFSSSVSFYPCRPKQIPLQTPCKQCRSRWDGSSGSTLSIILLLIFDLTPICNMDVTKFRHVRVHFIYSGVKWIVTLRWWSDNEDQGVIMNALNSTTSEIRT